MICSLTHYKMNVCRHHLEQYRTSQHTGVWKLFLYHYPSHFLCATRSSETLCWILFRLQKPLWRQRSLAYKFLHQCSLTSAVSLNCLWLHHRLSQPSAFLAWRVQWTVCQARTVPSSLAMRGLGFVTLKQSVHQTPHSLLFSFPWVQCPAHPLDFLGFLEARLWRNENSRLSDRPEFLLRRNEPGTDSFLSVMFQKHHQLSKGTPLLQDQM